MKTASKPKAPRSTAGSSTSTRRLPPVNLRVWPQSTAMAPLMKSTNASYKYYGDVWQQYEHDLFADTHIFASLVSMGFDQFAGNEATVRHLREAIATERMPPALILAGPRGAGKYTLAIMLAQAMACLQHPVTDGLPDFFGVCSNCTRIALSLPLSDRVNEAIAAREELREVDKKETRILVQTHPDVVVVPPDPPQVLIKLGQVCTVLQRSY